MINMGNVKSIKSGLVMKQSQKRNGYMNIALFKDGKYKYPMIHRIVAESFVSNPFLKQEVNHIDGNKTNNSAVNLEWATRNENLKHAFENNLRANDVSNKKIVCWKQESPSEKMYFKSIYRAAKTLKISKGNICMACKSQRVSASGYIFQYAN
jgi:hypothetical protein